ncbi:hypothetical protein DRQ53_12305 [bacterium]|nr:MAG: hypothetical protein DRQ53_12305 [bacterium]
MRVAPSVLSAGILTGILAGSLAGLLLPALAAAQDFGDLAGTLDVSHVESDLSGIAEESWRQLYTLNWYKRLTDYIDVRAGVRYFEFDLDSSAEFLGTFQEELQPSGELSWNHPWFSFTATASRRISRSPAIADKLVNDSVLLNWESAWMDTPVFGLRYELQNLEETGAGAFRNVNDERLTASVDYDRKHESFKYRLTRSWNENVVRGLSTIQNEQRLQYIGSHAMGSRRQFQLGSQYRYSRVDRVSQVASGERFLERVEASRGLGTIDATPDIGPLSNVPGLIDGNTLVPVVPPLAIGTGDLDRNVGVDLGARRDRVAAVYIYTDRLSSVTVQWSVWISEDNLNWDDSAILAVNSSFNAAVSRYEIDFNEVSARYVKVVNGGLNSVAGVQVTEIEVFESLPVSQDVEQDASSHQADARLVWNIDPDWQASVDGVARLEPQSGTLEQRLDYSYSMRVRYQPRMQVAHVIRLSQFWQEFEEAGRDLRDDTAGYSFLYDPLPTLGSNISASFRQSYVDDELSLRLGNALLGANATPWRAIRVAAEFGVSRVDQPVQGFLNDAWNTRLSIDSEITRQFKALVTWLHQESRRDNEIRVLRRVTMRGELQVTSAVFARASYTVADDHNFSRMQDYLLSWRLFVRLLLTGQARIDDSNAKAADSSRYSLNASLDLLESFLGFRNVTLYARFSDVDQRDAGGLRIISWQQGIRAAF